MIAFRVSSILVLAPVVCFGFATEAAAHIELTEPKARYEVTGLDTGIKGCPCGVATGTGPQESNRTCNVERDGSDPNRNVERASSYVAGSKLTIKFDETIDHPGRYRVAFDPEGADFDDFNDTVLADVPDPRDGTGARELEITLPNMACDNCTLQLTQVMEVSVDEPVDGDNLENLSTYYTCIDITLTGGEGDTSDAASSDTGSDSTRASGAESSEVASGETSHSSESSGSAGTPSSPASSGSDEQTAETEATSTRPAPTSTATTITNATSTAATSAVTQGPTTTTAAVTSVENTTSPDATTDNEGDDNGEAGCSVVLSPKPSVTLVATFGAVALGLFLRRRLT
jgi:hypothetical protein